MISLDIKKSFDDPGREAPFHLGIRLEMPEDSRTLVLFGASGSGKTLTLHCLAGLVRPDAGRIVVDGNVLYDSEQGICVPARRRRIGYMFQDYALFPHLSVLHKTDQEYGRLSDSLSDRKDIRGRYIVWIGHRCG